MSEPISDEARTEDVTAKIQGAIGAWLVTKDSAKLGNEIRSAITAATAEVVRERDEARKERDDTKRCFLETSRPQWVVDKILAERDTALAQLAEAKAALERISKLCPRVLERAEGGISDYGGNGDDMVYDYQQTALSDIGDIARAILNPTTKKV